MNPIHLEINPNDTLENVSEEKAASRDMGAQVCTVSPHVRMYLKDSGQNGGN